jgi:hypothetical protein
MGVDLFDFIFVPQYMIVILRKSDNIALQQYIGIKSALSKGLSTPLVYPCHLGHIGLRIQTADK